MYSIIVFWALKEAKHQKCTRLSVYLSIYSMELTPKIKQVMDSDAERVGEQISI